MLEYEKDLPTLMLNRAAKDGNVPCMVAQMKKKRCAVYLACDNKMCPHHHTTAPNYEELSVNAGNHVVKPVKQLLANGMAPNFLRHFFEEYPVLISDDKRIFW